VEQQEYKNVAVLYTNARNIGFPRCTFDIALCGFMGWDDCFDYVRNDFTQPDTKAPEIRRVLREGGRFFCCSWEAQDDLTFMEESMQRYLPEILQDEDYLEHRPIGMAYEKAAGYEIILRSAGFRQIEIDHETSEFVSTDEAAWWQMMLYLGWDMIFTKTQVYNEARLAKVKQSILTDLQPHKQPDGIHFAKTVFYLSAVK
jgi:ubiquinone/menaquinone biosynthesis C-methylase UbiE